MATIGKRISAALAALRGVPQEISGEVAFADPYRLYSGGMGAPFNPSDIVGRKGLRVFDVIRRDEQVKAATKFKKHAVMSSGWQVRSPKDQDDDWEVTELVRNNLERMAGTLENALLNILTSVDYGFSVTEKVFEFAEGKVNLKALKTRRPHSFNFKQDEHGNVTALIQDQTMKQVELPIAKFVIYTHDGEFGNPYGTSDLEATYRAWWTKNNTYKWLGMFLEKQGIPPIFALYDSSKFRGQTLEELKSVLKRLQAATVGAIPRGSEKDSLEMWSPDFSGQVARTFIPALDRMDQDIARGVLMPGLMGLSPEAGVGSQARARVIFDVFMLVVEMLRQEITETVMNEQVVRPLVDLNYTVEEYPRFELNAISDEKRLDLMEMWLKMIEKGAVETIPDDERHIRDTLEFPERDVTENPADPGGDGEPLDDPSDPDPGEKLPIDFKQYRQLRSVERRVNFRTMERALDDREAAIAIKLRNIILHYRGQVRSLIDRKDLPDVRDDLARLTFENAFRKDLASYVVAVFELGRKTVRDELPREFKIRKPNFIPRDAVQWLRDKAAEKAKGLNVSVRESVAQALSKSIELGETGLEAQARVDESFAPFIGSAEAIAPTPTTPKGGPLPKARLETIVRTETTTALNKGRLVEARRRADLMRGMMYSAILDGRTTEVCMYLDGRTFKISDPQLDKLTPPNHYNCRSILVPITIADDRPDDWISPSQAGKGEELAGKGFV